MVHVKRKEKNRIKVCLYLIAMCLVSSLILFTGTPAQAGTIELPQTGQTTCYKANGTSEACFGTGQDGDWLAGVDWPNPRFTIDTSLQCITDNLTGLTWVLNISGFSANLWQPYVNNIRTLTFACGYSDWRIPNVNELQSLINAEVPDNASWLESIGFVFPFSTQLPYWTSTSVADNSTVNAWIVDMVTGRVFPDNKGNPFFVWPVRGTSNPSTDIPPGQIAETGQVTISTTYDDAWFATTPTQNVGVPWPSTRFTTSGDCVTDNLTGLMWSRDANLDGLKSWDNALTFTNDISMCGYVDWRLPNSKELFSLIDRSQSGPALLIGHPFARVQSTTDDLYWTSTTYAYNTTGAWTVDMFRGGLNPHVKTDTAFVWPVRGGQTRPFVLTVQIIGNGKGKITAPGLTCTGKICSGEYASYDIVKVQATAQTGSAFTEWGYCPSPSGNTCEVTMTSDISVTAAFVPEYKISVNPKSLNFKNLKQGVESSPLSVTVKNIGVADLLIGLPVLAGDSPSVFAIADNGCTAPLSYNDTCAITITATSPDYDQKSAQLQIPSNDSKTPTVIVKLKAKAKPPKITKKPGSLNFGKVPRGTPVEKTLTLTNKGVTDLQVPFGGVISVTNPTEFSFSPATCSTLVTGATCELTITFTPSVAEKRSAVLNIPSNDPKKPVLTVNLKGTGE